MIKVARGKIARLPFCFAGSRLAMTMFALMLPRIAIVSFDLRCATPVLPIAIGRTASSPSRSLPKTTFNALGNRPSAPKSP
jgi:hypothetical protein